MAEIEQPIIIKKIYKVEGGHHGGAWKVAYADFVTAMMAFFLLLWLLSAANAGLFDVEALADYFTPTVGLKDQAGIGFQGGTAPTDIGDRKDNKTPPAIVVGQQPQGPIPQTPEKKALIESTEDANLFEKAEEQIKKALEEDPNLQEIQDNIIVEQTPEGLKIEILDSDKDTMFKPGGAELTNFGKDVLKRMLPVIQKMPNHISLTGHTDATPFPKGSMLSNWDLSTQRANASRRYLVEQGMEGERPAKIVGRADKELLLPNEPKSPRNRRITIILLRGSHLAIPVEMQPATRELLTVPKASDILEREEEKMAPKSQPKSPSETSVFPESSSPVDPHFGQ